MLAGMVQRLRPATPAELAPAVAAKFHEVYERLAPDFGYATRDASAVPWDQVPEANRQLMEATAAEVLGYLVGSSAITVVARIEYDDDSTDA